MNMYSRSHHISLLNYLTQLITCLGLQSYLPALFLFAHYAQ